MTYHASIFAVSQDANVPQTQLDKALIRQIDRRPDIQGNRCLYVVSMNLKYLQLVSPPNTYRIDKLRKVRGIGLAANVVIVDAGDLIHQAEV